MLTHAIILSSILMGHGGESDPAITEDCTFNGIPLHGNVQIVENFADIKVQVVDNFPDDCGQWEFVENFPDFKIQFVDSFPDIKIRFVESFPGVE